MISKLTKIIATIGPACDSPAIIADLIRAGVNVFRFNMKHSTVKWHEARIKRVQQVANKLATPIGVLIDLQGPELRLETRDEEKFSVEKDEEVLFVPEFLPNTKCLRIPHKVFFEVLKEGDEILIDDGFFEFVVIKAVPDKIIAKSLSTGKILNRKAVNLPGKKMNLSSLIADDLKRLDMAARNKIDYVALSFTRRREDLAVLKQELEKRKMSSRLVAKIESQEALDNIDEIIAAFDAVMIARGDLGLEVPIERLAHIQKTIIQKCREAKKPVITATQMLQSMVENPRPTRAEATDVANAVFDGTDALMLSGETASGMYPVRAVTAMAQIAAFNEKIANFPPFVNPPNGMTQLIVDAAAHLLKHESKPKIDAVVVFTETGQAPRDLAALRPKLPVLAISENQSTVEQLTLSFGVSPYKLNFKTGIASLKKMGVLKTGQHVLLIHSIKPHVPGPVNTLLVKKI